MLDKKEMYALIKEKPQYEELLFSKGYMITDDHDIDKSLHPFCRKDWIVDHLYDFDIWHDSRLKLFECRKEDGIYFMLGHAYNPFTMDYMEDIILEKMPKYDDASFWEYESGITGIYLLGIINEKGMKFWGDCTGKLMMYHGVIHDHCYVASHSRMIADMFDLEEDPYVTELKNYKYYPLLGCFLPGTLSPFKDIKRIVPNYLYEYYGKDISYSRFFPFGPIKNCANEEEYQEVVEKTADIMKNNMIMCAKKWPDRAAISLTGGRDRGLTFSAAVPAFDELKYFSYASKPEELVDFEAAGEICKAFNLEHIKYRIDDEEISSDEFEAYKEIIAYNMGNIGYVRDNEVRKRIVLKRKKDFDVEIKSWVSEVARAYWCKRYHKTDTGKGLKPRYLTTSYKIFLGNRRLAKKTDRVFKEYIREFMTQEDLAIYGNWQDIWSWEHQCTSLESQHLMGEHIISLDVTIPYNNRALMEIMLRPELKDWISDRLYDDVIRLNNPKQAELNISIVNAAHTDKRAFIERMYYKINTHLPY